MAIYIGLFCRIESKPKLQRDYAVGMSIARIAGRRRRRRRVY